MPKPNLNDILSIKDPMLADNFELLIPNVPGGGSARALRIQCKSAAKPGSTVNEYLMELFGHALVHAGALTFTHDLPVTYIEDSRGSITQSLEAWQAVVRSKQTQHGNFKADYAVDAEFIIYNQIGAKVLIYKIVNMWPNQVPDLQFEGSQGTQAIELSANFKFDIVDRIF